MKVEDLGLGPPIQNMNENISPSSSNSKRILFFNFISLCQIHSQKFRVFTYIASIFTLLQNIFISFWPYLNLNKFKLEKSYYYMVDPPGYEKILSIIFYFFTIGENADTIYTISFIIFFLSLFFFILSLICFCLYYFKRIINFQLLFCFSFFIQLLCPILIIPIGFQTGFLIFRIYYLKYIAGTSDETEKGGSIAIFVLLAVLNGLLYLIIIFITVITNIFNSNSVIISKSFSVPFNWFFESCSAVIPSVILFFSNFLPLFEEKLRYFVVFLHALYCVLMIIWTFWIPFGIVKSNSIFAAISLTMIFADASCFTVAHDKWYRYLVFAGVLIIFFFIMNFFIKLRIKCILKVKKNVEEKEDEKDLDKEDTEGNEAQQNQVNSRNKQMMFNSPKFQMFGDPEVEPTGFEDSTVSEAIFALRVAMLSRSKIFIEGKLVDLIMTKVETDYDKIRLSLIICYFPDFQPFFFSLLTSMKRVQFLPFILDYQLYQLRCFDISNHSNEKVKEIDDAIHESYANENLIRSLWQVIYSECCSYENNSSDEKAKDSIPENIKLKANMFPLFDRFSTSIFNCKSKWKNLIDLYPNNIQIAEEYSKFLIECCGDFIGASEWKTISTELQQGKMYKFNPAVVSFLRAYPAYCRNIVPKKLSMVNLDDIDIHARFDNISKFIDMPETRFEYQRSTNFSYPLAIYVFAAASIISLLYILIFWFYGFYCFQHFDIMIDSMNFITNTALVSEQISKSIICAIMNYGQSDTAGFFPTPDVIYNTIFENGVDDRFDSVQGNSLVQINGNYKSQIVNFVEQGITNIYLLNTDILRQIGKGINFELIMNEFFFTPYQYEVYLSKTVSKPTLSTLQTLAISSLVYYYFISVDENYSYIEDPEWYCATMAGTQVLENLEKVSSALLENIQISYKKTDNFNSVGVITIGIVYIVFSVLTIWINFALVSRNFNAIMNSLCFFPQNIKKKAICAIITNSEDIENQNPSVSTTYTSSNSNSDNNMDESYMFSVQSKIKNFVIIAMVFSTIIHIILGVIIFSFLLVYKKYKSQFVNICDLVYYYSVETSQIIDVLYSVMAANSFHSIVPSIEQKYKDKMYTAYDRFLKSHQARWSYSVDGDCGITGEYLTLINDLKNQEKCPSWEDKTYHEIISCLSEESGINAFIDLTESMVSNIDNQQLMKTELFIQYLHFTLSHIYFDVSNFQVYLRLGALDKQDSYVSIIRIFGSVSFVVAFVLFYINIQIFLKMKKIYKLLFAFISRIHPSDLILNSQLLKALFEIKSTKKEEIENVDVSFIVQDSSVPAIFIDRSALIEFVNSAFTRKTGLESNFIVGQPISTLIDDDSIIFYIDKMKFFETRKSITKSFLFKKENGNKTLYDLTIIPIHNASKSNKGKDKQEVDPNNSDDEDENNEQRSTFVNRIAIIFMDKTTEINLKKRCLAMKALTSKIEAIIYPNIFNLFIDGHLKMCAICLVKLPNVIHGDTSSKTLLAQRQTLYELLYEKLNIYPLLQPLDSKNGIFAVIGCQKNDPIELGIECLNFAFNIVDEFTHLMTASSSHSSGLIFSGQFFAVVETGGELIVSWLGNQSKKVVITGELMDRAMKVLDNANKAGTICVSKKTYEHLIQLDYSYVEKEISEEICGCNYIFSIEKDFHDSIFDVSKRSSEYSEDRSSNTNSFGLDENT